MTVATLYDVHGNLPALEAVLAEVPGDALIVETEILELRPSRSRPGHGIIRLRNVTTNQRGEVVQTMLASAMVPRRAVSTT